MGMKQVLICYFAFPAIVLLVALVFCWISSHPTIRVRVKERQDIDRLIFDKNIKQFRTYRYRDNGPWIRFRLIDHDSQSKAIVKNEGA
jgi:hypothetical protein